MTETEKITINMAAVDLGKVDLLEQESLYSNRTHFIRTPIHNQLDRHNLEIQQSVTRHSYVIGITNGSTNNSVIIEFTSEMLRKNWFYSSVSFAASEVVKAVLADRMK
ncbi:MAG: CopG family transcriptional regulator [Chloroflexi bacterium]|nr:CopG family transcriptional regulator [Chloroflexota bacterium]